MCIGSRFMLSFFFLSKTAILDVIRESSHLVQTERNGLMAGASLFLHWSLCKILEHWAAKGRNLTRHDLDISFWLRSCDIYFFQFGFLRTNFWLTADVIFLYKSWSHLPYRFKCLLGSMISTDRSEYAAKFEFASVLLCYFDSENHYCLVFCEHDPLPILDMVMNSLTLYLNPKFYNRK